MARYRLNIFASGKDSPEIWEAKELASPSDAEAIEQAKVEYAAFGVRQEQLQSKHRPLFFEIKKDGEFFFSSQRFGGLSPAEPHDPLPAGETYWDRIRKFFRARS